MPSYDKADVLAAMHGRFIEFYQSRGAELKPDGREWRGACPIHNGTGPNFTVDPETGFWHCHSQGCGKPGGDVFTFVQEVAGLDFAEALALVAEWVSVSTSPFRPGVASAPERAACPKKTKPPRTAPTPEALFSSLGRPAAVFDYTDEQNSVLYKVLRFQLADGKKAFPQCQPCEQGWQNDIEGARRVLYRLPEVVSAVAAGKPVYVCEGEKATNSLRSLGVAATCNSGGAGNWPQEIGQALCGAGVVILPDNDDAGRKHAQKVALLLHGTAKRVRIVTLPGLPPRGDAVEWIAAGGTLAHLNELVRQTPDWTPETQQPDPPPSAAVPQPSSSSAASAPPRRKTIAERIIDLADVEPSGELPLMFGQYLLKGAAHWMTGQTGLGKSTFAYNLACALAEGSSLWGIECEPQRILYMDMESGDVGRALKVERLYLDTPRVRGQLLFAREPIHLPEELGDLTAFGQAEGITLVIFDTARRCFTVKDENDNAEVYNRVVPTLDALKRLGIATLTMGHPPKNGNLGARGAGAQEDAGDVNLTLTMHKGEVSDQGGVIALRVTKNRLLGLGVPALYLKRAGNDRFERISAEEACSGAASAERPGRQNQCRMDITEFMEVRPQRHAAFTEIITAMKDRGHSQSTAKRIHREMKDDGELTPATGGGWILTDPFE